MHEQIHEIIDDLKRAQERVHALARRAPDEQWGVRSDPDRWSINENIEHLNLTTEAFLPILSAALKETAQMGGKAPARYRRDPMGWMLWRMMPPPVRFSRTTTKPSFVPRADMPADQVRTRFDGLQKQLIALTATADGLPIDRRKIASPFEPRASYNLFAALGILPRHQHRHLWHAENTLK